MDLRPEFDADYRKPTHRLLNCNLRINPMWNVTSTEQSAFRSTCGVKQFPDQHVEACAWIVPCSKMIYETSSLVSKNASPEFLRSHCHCVTIGWLTETTLYAAQHVNHDEWVRIWRVESRVTRWRAAIPSPR